MSNTVAAKSWRPGFQVAYTEHGGPAKVVHLTVAAAETILEGDPIVLSSGDAAEGAGNSGSLYGVALHDAAAAADLAVAVAAEGTVFVGKADAQTDGTEIGAECDIVASGTDWLIDIGSSTEDVLKIVDFVPEDDATDGTTPGRLFFKIKRSSYNDLLAAL